MKTEVKVMIAIIVVAVAILVLGAFVFSKNTTSNTPTQTGEPVSMDLLIKPNSRTRGSLESPVKLVEFADFECPACAYTHPMVEKIVAEYDGRISYTYRHFPLHFNSYPAVNAAEAAGEQGKFWEMYNLLFTKQKEWGGKQSSVKDILVGYAQELSLDVDAFEKVLKDGKYDDLVNADKADGNAAGVQGTPSFFINGKKIPSVPSYDELKALIEAELSPAPISVDVENIETTPVEAQ